MNFLTLIFSLLLLVAFGTHVILEKQSTQHKLKSSYLGHVGAQRSIFNQNEGRLYRNVNLPITPYPEKPQEKKQKKKRDFNDNLECARINLLPLIEEGKENKSALYEVAQNMIKVCYGDQLFEGNLQAVKKFLDTFLKECAKNPSVELEKLSLHNDAMQTIYYRMLKGTKKLEGGFPSLLDLIKIEKGDSTVCLVHARPVVLSVLLGPKAAHRLFEEIHRDPQFFLSKERVKTICLECHALPPSEEILDMISYHPAKQGGHKKTTYIAEEGAVVLKKQIYPLQRASTL